MSVVLRVSTIALASCFRSCAKDNGKHLGSFVGGPSLKVVVNLEINDRNLVCVSKETFDQSCVPIEDFVLQSHEVGVRFWSVLLQTAVCFSENKIRIDKSR